MTNAQAFLHKEKTNKITVKPKIWLSFIPDDKESRTTYSKLQAPDFTHKIKSDIIDFNKMKPKNKITQLKERYLTLYSDKKEKLKVSYLQGTYAINYTQSW